MHSNTARAAPAVVSVLMGGRRNDIWQSTASARYNTINWFYNEISRQFAIALLLIYQRNVWYLVCVEALFTSYIFQTRQYRDHSNVRSNLHLRPPLHNGQFFLWRRTSLQRQRPLKRVLNWQNNLSTMANTHRNTHSRFILRKSG